MPVLRLRSVQTRHDSGAPDRVRSAVNDTCLRECRRNAELGQKRTQSLDRRAALSGKLPRADTCDARVARTAAVAPVRRRAQAASRWRAGARRVALPGRARATAPA